MQPRSVTLEELLASRERRAARQQALLAEYPGCLVSFTVNCPGPVKHCAASLAVHRAGVQAISDLFKPSEVLYNEQVELVTGPEGYWCVSLEPQTAKEQTCRLEDTHPLGRLMDVDVLGPDGVPVSRRQLGYPPRTCLLCGGDPVVCRREGIHSLEELTAAIDAMVEQFTG